MTATTETTALAEAYLEMVRTGRVPDATFAADVLWDVNVPHWRFQLQGADAVVRLHEEDYREPPTIESHRSTPAGGGFLLEYVQRAVDHHGRAVYSRIAVVFETAGNVVTEARVYCTGDWDQQTEARQKLEAPMIKP